MGNKLEYILMAMFGGGIADWQDIAETKYDWEEIFKNARNRYFGENIKLEMNDLYAEILTMARDELVEIIEEYVEKANTKEEIILANKIEDISKEDFEIFTNYLDTHIWFRGTEEQGTIIQELFEHKIDTINDKIGFTYINFD